MANNNVFDFGFTFSDGTDIPEMVQMLEHAESLKKSRNDALETVLAMMNNFLNNLAREPDKKYLLWPDRAAKVKEFQEKLNHYAD